MQGYLESKRKVKKLQDKLKSEFGNIPERSYTKDELDSIKKQFYRRCNEHCIDDITASDLDLDLIYKRINYSKSSQGDSYLYMMLRNPELISDLDSFESKVRYFYNNENDRIKISNYFLTIGRLGKTDFFECIDCIEDVEKRNLLKDYFTGLFVLIGIGLIFINPSVGIIVTLAALITNIISYYAARGTIEPYIITFSFINRFIKQALLISDNDIEILKDENVYIKNINKKLLPFTKKAKFLNSSGKGLTGIGNPFEIVIDYFKMIFHIDIIAFYKMLSFIKQERYNIETLYFELGKIESYLNICLLRASYEEWCNPHYCEELKLVDAYHPLLNKPVKNSIKADKSVLITGSNASGKSTFLRTVAINILLAQTINTCLCKEYYGKKYSLFSSMSLKDDICGNESYFMVEIKAMKRVLTYAANYPERTVICFIDEILRGTNTVERISSSTEVLKYLVKKGCVCFAATHDGELTYLLENDYSNYHFNEDIRDNDVLFDYKLLDGRATSRNAIKLLEVMGFDKNITENALKRADNFTKTGSWI